MKDAMRFQGSLSLQRGGEWEQPEKAGVWELSEYNHYSTNKV